MIILRLRKEDGGMEIGKNIRELRMRKGIRQEDFANAIGVSVQTVSRWENDVNVPDLSMLPVLARYFRVTTDHLLGVKGETMMAKLIKTVETFELSSREDAEKMVSEFRAATFPRLIASTITEKDGVYTLEVVKEFGVDVNSMKFD